MADMVEHSRLAALAGALFVLSYSGVAWTMAGAPLPALSAGWFTQEARVAALPAARGQVAVALLPEPDLNSRDGDPVLDKLRLAAIQASNAYAMSPCDGAVKANLVAMVSAYAQAWHDMMGCGPGGCDHDKLNAAAITFSTPLDMKVRAAVSAAFDKRGIIVDEFPAPLRINVAMLARGPGDPAVICGTTRAEGMR